MMKVEVFKTQNKRDKLFFPRNVINAYARQLCLERITVKRENFSSSETLL